MAAASEAVLGNSCTGESIRGRGGSGPLPFCTRPRLKKLRYITRLIWITRSTYLLGQRSRTSCGNERCRPWKNRVKDGASERIRRAEAGIVASPKARLGWRVEDWTAFLFVLGRISCRLLLPWHLDNNLPSISKRAPNPKVFCTKAERQAIYESTLNKLS